MMERAEGRKVRRRLMDYTVVEMEELLSRLTEEEREMVIWAIWAEYRGVEMEEGGNGT